LSLVVSWLENIKEACFILHWFHITHAENGEFHDALYLIAFALYGFYHTTDKGKAVNLAGQSKIVHFLELLSLTSIVRDRTC
jgi:hypothetical protein